MNTIASTLACPMDGAVLTALPANDARRPWHCPTCHRQWSDDEALKESFGSKKRLETTEEPRASARAALQPPTPATASQRPATGAAVPYPGAAGDRLARRTERDGRALGGLATFHPFRVIDAAADAVAKPAADGPRTAEPGAGVRNEVELFYDTIAEDFDRIMNRYDLRRRVDTLFHTLLGRYDLTGRSLLDAGCGTGWFSRQACIRGARVTALDIGPKLLDQVRRKCSAETVCGSVLDLRFPDGRFDVVVSSECIDHTPDPQQAVQELVRVCRPGGLIAITCSNHFWYWLCAVANRLHLRPYEGLENWPTWSGLRDWVTQAGAQIIEMRGIHLFPFQVSLFHPLLKQLDRFGRLWGRFCVNQAVLAVKLC